MKIYISSFFDTRARLRPHRDVLWAMGHEVVSTWLDEVAQPDFISKAEFWRKLAIKDLAQVESADIVIVDTIDVSPRGGREVEFGYGLGGHQSKLHFLVGPVRNVFHTLADKGFASWEECLLYIRGMNGGSKPNSTPGDVVVSFTATPSRR